MDRTYEQRQCQAERPSKRRKQGKMYSDYTPHYCYLLHHLTPAADAPTPTPPPPAPTGATPPEGEGGAGAGAGGGGSAGPAADPDPSVGASTGAGLGAGLGVGGGAGTGTGSEGTDGHRAWAVNSAIEWMDLENPLRSRPSVFAPADVTITSVCTVKVSEGRGAVAVAVVHAHAPHISSLFLCLTAYTSCTTPFSPPTPKLSLLLHLPLPTHAQLTGPEGVQVHVISAGISGLVRYQDVTHLLATDSKRKVQQRMLLR